MPKYVGHQGYHWRHPKIVAPPNTDGARKTKMCIDCAKPIERRKMRCSGCSFWFHVRRRNAKRRQLTQERRACD